MEVTSIQNGIIIDHVPAGTSLKVLDYLKIDPSKTKLALIMNADSKRYGSKDIIKIEDDKDIDLEHPEILDRLPETVTLLNWQYDPQVTDEKIRTVAQSGATQIVCCVTK